LRSAELESVIQNAGNAEITKFDTPTFCEENVLGFQIPMKDLPIMDVLNRQAELDEIVQDLLFR
jgi:hypothetical protein